MQIELFNRCRDAISQIISITSVFLQGSKTIMPVWTLLRESRFFERLPTPNELRSLWNRSLRRANKPWRSVTLCASLISFKDFYCGITCVLLEGRMWDCLMSKKPPLAPDGIPTAGRMRNPKRVPRKRRGSATCGILSTSLQGSLFAWPLPLLVH